MMTINEIQDEIIDEFSGLDDWMDKYQLLMRATSLTVAKVVYGCKPTMWMARLTSPPRVMP